MPERDELDQLIRSALSTYGQSGTDPGLEERILARIANEREPARSHRWLPWAIALPIAAGLLLLLILSGSRQIHHPSNSAEIAQPSGQPLYTATRPEVSTGLYAAPAHRAKIFLPQTQPRMNASVEDPLPKLDVFPTPQPLTREERALAVFANHAPEPELRALADAQSQAGAPLNIAAIQIQPLDPPDDGGN